MLAQSVRYQAARTDFDHDAVTDAPAFYDSTDLSSRQRSTNRTDDSNIPATDIVHLSGGLFVLFIVFGCHYLHALNKNSFAGSTHLTAPEQKYSFHEQAKRILL